MKKRMPTSTCLCVILVATLAAASVAHAQLRPDTAWVRVVGEGEVYESCMGVFEAPDGGVITCGTLQDGPEGPYYGVFHRLDPEGNEVWSRRSLGIHTYMSAGVLGPSHELVVTGGASGGLLLAALDMNGDTLWTSTAQNGPSAGECVTQTADGRYAVGGDAPSSVTDAAIAFFDSSGQYLYCRIYPDSVNPQFFSGWIKSILALEDSGLVFVADVFLQSESWLARLDSEGDTVWTRRIQSDTAEVHLLNVIQLTDGTFLYSGYTWAAQASYELFGKLDQNGVVIWDSLYALSVGFGANNGIAPCPDGGWVAAGVTDCPSVGYDCAVLMRFNAQGDTLWSWLISDVDGDYSGDVVATLSDGGFALGGVNWGYDPIWRRWTLVVRTEPEGSGVSDKPRLQPDQFVLESVYPNPFNSATTIEFTLKRSAVVQLRLYDVLGRLAMVVYEGWTPAGRHRFPLHASNLASGEYFLHAEALGMMQTGKIVLLR